MPKEITIDSLKKKPSRMKTADKHYSDSEIYKRITTSTYRRMSSSKKVHAYTKNVKCNSHSNE